MNDIERGAHTASDTAEPASAPLQTQTLAQFEPGREAEFLAILLEHLDVGVSMLDDDLRYRLISAGVYREMGIDPSELGVGSSLSDCHRLMQDRGLLTQDMIDAQHLSEDKQRVNARQGKDYDGGLVTLGNGTTHRHKRTTLGNGYTLSIANNVSELVEKDKLLESALFLGQAGYWTYEFATREYSLSKSFTTFIGKEMTEIVLDKGIIHCVNPEDRPAYRDALATLKTGASRFTVDGRTTAVWGEERWSRTVAELVRDPHGRPLRIRAFVRDITDMRRKEDELERVKDEAIAASHAKSEFLANMSHEIRTPMNGVLGMAELLAGSDIDERQREYVNVINSSASALLNIINDILDFSKIEAGALEIDPMPFDLRSCIADVTALMVTKSQEQRIELIIDYPEDLPRHFIGDAGRIRQILTNLVGNGIKFTQKGYVRTTVGVRRKGDMAVISIDVKDTGIGIPKQKQQSVFDKFTQADGSTTRVYGGTGLGLTITKRIVEMMSGRIGVESTLGEGSTFSVRLPLQIDNNARVESFDTEVLAGKRVLVVDDIDVNCKVLRRQLGNWGMRSECSHDGVDAVNAIQQAQAEGNPFDLILLDYLMPGINGRELAAMMSTREDLDMPPVIMLSSCDQSVSSLELARNGIESYLVKPVRERRLYDTVVRVLSNPVCDIEQRPAAVTPEDSADPAAAKTEILVAEDFELNQDVVRLMLSGSAYEPVFAENGDVAVKAYLAEPNRFPLILMDVSMPVKDGHMASREIRAWEAETGRAPVPIIALTGHALKSDQEECMKAGMNDFLTKPVKQVALLDKIENNLGHAIDVSRDAVRAA